MATPQEIPSMGELVSMPGSTPHASVHDKMHRSPGAIGIAVFGVVFLIGVIYAGYHLLHDLQYAPSTSAMPYVLLGIALFVALGFEFVNGFHDTANAVATVIYTHSLEPHYAVVWSGFFNFLGVMVASGLVAFKIISLLPVELILQVGSSAGFAMVFALLVAAIIWNLGTWWFGLPASSSHTLIGSVIGVGIANQILSGRNGTSGVDWGQAIEIGKSLLLSPLVGFAVAALLLLAAKALIKDEKLYKAPEGTQPPPFYIRCLLILTCTGVSFFHGSNDGQKGMGLIMLILIGTVPTAYALNHAVTYQQSQDFIAVSQQAANVLDHYVTPGAVIGDARDDVTAYVRTKQFNANTMLAMRTLVNDIGTETANYKELKNVPNDRVRNFRNDLYLVSEALRLIQKSGNPKFADSDAAILANYKKHVDYSTRFIPTWVKVAVAMALGLGTMVGWKRIVITVGEKIGKTHLTYAQGAAAEITAMATIGAADGFGLPVSTTHVLSSGVAGTMAANHSGIQLSTIRNLALAWVLTLPVAMILSGLLFWLFRHIF
jgi:inorganic phosphate transporter, PiT family